MSVSVCLYASNIQTPVEDSTERKSTPTATELKFTREQKNKQEKKKKKKKHSKTDSRRNAGVGHTSVKKAFLHAFARALLFRQERRRGRCVCVWTWMHYFI